MREGYYGKRRSERMMSRLHMLKDHKQYWLESGGNMRDRNVKKQERQMRRKVCSFSLAVNLANLEVV